jgi:Helix-turn-helix.
MQDMNLCTLNSVPLIRGCLKRDIYSICRTMAAKNVKKLTGSIDESEEMLKKIANRIKQLRIKAGYSSLEKFAYEHEISRTQYARYEKGEDMRLTSLMRIVAAHGMTLQEFFKGVV